MNKKEFELGVVCLLVCGSLLFATPYPNKQKIYSLDSDVYEAISVLYVDQGLSLPSTTAPYSQAELEMMLKKLNPDRMGEAAKATYTYVCDQLGIQPQITGSSIGMTWQVGANLETYFHTNTTDFVGRDTWIRGFNEQKPMLAIGLETWPGKNFYGYSEFTVANTNTLNQRFGSTTFATNVIMVPPAVMTDLDFNMPYRAFVAAGGDSWTLQIGRDRMNWGAGVTGNLMLGNNIKYHNMVRFTTFSSKFKYTFVTSFFPHPQQYISDTSHSGATVGDSQEEVLDGIYMFMAHRLEWRMFHDKVGLTLTESIMYQSEENLLDFRILNPAMIFHDYYIRSNANSLLGLELDWTATKNLSLYGQIVVDEFALPGEPVASDTQSGFPTAFGYLAGVKYLKPLSHDDLVVHASLEAAYTDPFLYLRYGKAQGDGTISTNKYGLSYVVAIREFTNQDDMQFHSSYLGYAYGGDAIVFNLNGGVKQYGRWNVEANVFSMIHGTFDMFTVWSTIGGSSGVPASIHTPTTHHYTENYNDSDVSDRDSASYTLVLGTHGSYTLTNHVSAYGQLDYVKIWNYGNVSGVTTGDVQLTLGVSYAL